MITCSGHLTVIAARGKVTPGRTLAGKVTGTTVQADSGQRAHVVTLWKRVRHARRPVDHGRALSGHFHHWNWSELQYKR